MLCGLYVNNMTNLRFQNVTNKLICVCLVNKFSAFSKSKVSDHFVVKGTKMEYTPLNESDPEFVSSKFPKTRRYTVPFVFSEFDLDFDSSYSYIKDEDSGKEIIHAEIEESSETSSLRVRGRNYFKRRKLGHHHKHNAERKQKIIFMSPCRKIIELKNEKIAPAFKSFKQFAEKRKKSAKENLKVLRLVTRSEEFKQIKSKDRHHKSYFKNWKAVTDETRVLFKRKKAEFQRESNDN